GDEALVGDGQTGLGEEPLGIMLVDGGARARREHGRQPAGGARRGRVRRRRHAPPRESSDGAETLARPADDGDAVLAEKRQHVAPEDAGARRHVVERLRRAGRALDEDAGVGEQALGGAERLVVEAVATEGDRIIAGIRAEGSEGAGKIRGVVAVAPGIQRIAVTREDADGALDLGARGWRRRGQVESRRARQVEDQLGLAARGGHHRDPAPPWPARPLTACEHLDHLVHVAYLDGATGAQNGGEDARLPGEAARVAGDGAPRALRPADLENDDGLAAIRRAVEGGHEALGLAHGLEKEGDDPRGRIVDEELEVVSGREDRLVARRDHVAESEPPAIREETDAEGAALRDETDVAGE